MTPTHRWASLPIATAPHDGAQVQIRSAEDGGWYDASWNPDGFTYDLTGKEVVAGRWETDESGGFIADREAEAWRPCFEQMMAAQRC